MFKKDSNEMEFRGVRYERFLFDNKTSHRCNSCDLYKFLDDDDYPPCACLDASKGEVIKRYYWKEMPEGDLKTVCPHCGELYKTTDK